MARAPSHLNVDVRIDETSLSSILIILTQSEVLSDRASCTRHHPDCQHLSRYLQHGHAAGGSHRVSSTFEHHDQSARSRGYVGIFPIDHADGATPGQFGHL